MDYLIDNKVKEIYQKESVKDDFDICDWNDNLVALKQRLVKDMEQDPELLDQCIHSSMYKIKTWTAIESVFTREHPRFILDQLRTCFEAQSMKLGAESEFQSIYAGITDILNDMKQVAVDQSVYQTKLMHQLQVVIEKDRADGDQIEFLRELSDCF